MKIAEVLRAWRHHEEMSIRQAAERVGIPWNTYARIESGRGVTSQTLATVVRWLLEP